MANTFVAYSLGAILGVGKDPVAALGDALSRGATPPFRMTIAQATAALALALCAREYTGVRFGELENEMVGTEDEYQADRKRQIKAERDREDSDLRDRMRTRRYSRSAPGATVLGAPATDRGES
jgi:hypothetical protein